MNYDKVKVRDKLKFRYRYWDTVLHKYTKSIYSDTLKELKIRAEAWESENKSGFVENHQMLSKFFKEWLFTVHMVDKKPSTKTRYDSIYRCHILPSYLGKMKIKNIMANDLQKFYNEKTKETSESVCKGIHKLMKPCFRYAKNSGYISIDITEMVKLPKNLSVITKKISKVKPLTFEEQMIFIEDIKGERYQALYNTAIDTGARQGELFALVWNDINFQTNNISINKSLSYVKNLETNLTEKFITDTKTKKSNREIPLPDRLRKILIEHKFNQQHGLNAYGINQDDGTNVFTTPIGTSLESSNILKDLKRLYERIGISKKNFHDLRHTYATRLFELDVPAKTVQVLLGHSDVAITLNTYTHVLEKQKIKTASLIDAIYLNVDSIGYTSVTEPIKKITPSIKTAL